MKLNNGYVKDIDLRAERAQLEAELAFSARERKLRMVHQGICAACETERQQIESRRVRKRFFDSLWYFLAAAFVGFCTGLALALGYAQLFEKL